MGRIKTEIHKFSKADIEDVLKFHTKMAIISGSFFIGEFGKQTVYWNQDGSVSIETTYTQGD